MAAVDAELGEDVARPGGLRARLGRRGGHFVPVEEPELYAEELRAFFRPCRAATG